MVRDAESHADEARRLRELADTRNLGETLAYQTETTLAEHREAIEPADAATIEGRIMELRQAVEGSDVAEIKAKTDALNEAAQPLAQALYAQAQAGTSTPPQGGNGSASTEDEVVEDAEFEVIDEDEAAKTS
ncbi:MAG: Hsp70 family protein, partial [Gaiella sp.]